MSINRTSPIASFTNKTHKQITIRINNEDIQLKEGDIIKFKRPVNPGEDEYTIGRITGFKWSFNSGPLGIIFIPLRVKEKRWSSSPYGRLISFYEGSSDWSTITKIVCNPVINGGGRVYTRKTRKTTHKKRVYSRRR